MRVLIYAYGSRGDVQPFVALADRLARSGHDPVLAAPGRFRELAEGRGLQFRPLDDRLADFFLTDPDVVAVQTLPSPPMKLLVRTWRKLRVELDRCLPVMLDQMLAAASGGADLVVQAYDEIPVEQGHHVAEALGVPWVLATLGPYVVPSFHYPAKLLPPGREYPRLVNRVSHAGRVGMRALGRGTVRRWRPQALGLPNRWRQDNRMRAPGGVRVPVLHCFSPHVVRAAPDWPAVAHPTGFWFLQDLDQTGPTGPTPELAAFLAAGEPPVAVGFGSVRGLDPHQAGEAVVDAAQRAGVRVVVVRAGGSIEVDRCPPSVLVVEEVDYSWLFGRVAAVVHAASVGVSSEALRAGVPQVSVPPTPEAVAWADLLTAAGAAPPPIRLRDLTGENLAAALRRVRTDEVLRARIAELARLVRAEDGTATAVRRLEELAPTLEVRAPARLRLPPRRHQGAA